MISMSSINCIPPQSNYREPKQRANTVPRLTTDISTQFHIKSASIGKKQWFIPPASQATFHASSFISVGRMRNEMPSLELMADFVRGARISQGD
jgi:hypothetical protein